MNIFKSEKYFKSARYFITVKKPSTL